jgi:hypothetical protein
MNKEITIWNNFHDGEITAVEKDMNDVIWLVNSTGESKWTINHDFLALHFQIVFDFGNKDFYGDYALGPILEPEERKIPGHLFLIK